MKGSGYMPAASVNPRATTSAIETPELSASGTLSGACFMNIATTIRANIGNVEAGLAELVRDLVRANGAFTVP